MNLLKLSWKNIIHKPLSSLLSLILFALGVGLISILFLINTQLQQNFEKNLAGIDLVIGAKGSPLQLILSSMYHIDAPTGNISIQDAKPFLRPGHPIIENVYPLSLGDSYKAYRIVGTDTSLISLYDGKLAQGELWEDPMEVVVGNTLVTDERTKLKIGDTFFSSHGLIEDDNLVHDDAPKFKVVGTLAPTGTVLDQLILTSPQSIWQVHDHEGDHDHEESSNEEQDAEHDHEGHNHDEEGHEGHDHSDHEGHDHEGHDHDHSEHEEVAEPTKPLHELVDQDITAMLLKFKGRNIQALNMQRNINENTNLQAATPAIEINRLYSLVGTGEAALRALALIIVIVSGLSIFISLFSSLKERQYELSLMRVMGSSRGKIFMMILLEGLVLALLGYIIGIMLSHVGMNYMAGMMQDAYRYSFTGSMFLKEEWYLLGGALLVGVLAALIPAIQASNTDISETLAKG